MKTLILNILSKFTGNQTAQKLLEKISRLNRLLMGIGTGAFPVKSGEEFALRYVKELFSNDKEPFILFDVGANIGQFLELIISELQDHSYKVYSFEPGTTAFCKLKSNYGGLNNIVLENIGFDDHPNKSLLYFDQQGSLFASKYDRDGTRLNVLFDKFEMAEYSTIDQYCKEKKISKIHCLKIDVEGNELNVLRGAEDLFNNQVVKSVIFEFGSTQIDSRTFFKDIYFYLQNRGLCSLYRILPNGYLLPIESYDENLELFFTTYYLAIMK